MAVFSTYAMYQNIDYFMINFTLFSHTFELALLACLIINKQLKVLTLIFLRIFVSKVITVVCTPLSS